MGIGTSAGYETATTWLSCGLEELVDSHRWMGDPECPKPGDHDFDVIIVGSGYGGAVAAAELSSCRSEGNRPLRICVLERGKEYLTGMFPSRLANLPGHVRFATPDAARQGGVADGLFDIRWGEDLVALVASGVGGGSLINAGVMEMPKEYVFKEGRWPKKIRDDIATLNEFAGSLRLWVGASPQNQPLDKTSTLQNLARSAGVGPEKIKSVHISVASTSAGNAAGVPMAGCNLCGDCATGCNYNAKDSLDRNLLSLARQDGVKIVTGATVLSIARAASSKGWVVHVNHTDTHLRDRQRKPFVIRARRVILAAGTFGSTEILMRSTTLRLSSQLGRKFSANGDMIAAVHGLKARVGAVADETKTPDGGARGVGPTITAMIDLREGNPEKDLVIQDLAVPGPMRRLFQESFATTDMVNRLIEENLAVTSNAAPVDDAAVDSDAFEHSLLVAMIGRDSAEGELTRGRRPIACNADGLLTVKWPAFRHDSRFVDHHKRLNGLLRKARLDGRILSNPLWRPLSAAMEDVFGAQRGPLVTVHPLGGCSMGDDIRKGVTDHCGRVFDGNRTLPTATYDGLVILDGSIVPTSLGINPALTIASLALRAITELTKEWHLSGGRLAAKPPSDRRHHDRPQFSKPITKTDPRPTKIELGEQMRGLVNLRGDNGKVSSHWIELTLTTEPVAVPTLICPEADCGHSLTVPPARNEKAVPGRLRILHAEKTFDPVSDDARDEDVALVAEVHGIIRIFGISRPAFRRVRALFAWFCNRGLRDLAQSLIQWIRRKLGLIPPSLSSLTLKERFRAFLRLFSHAGSIRLIEYDLSIGQALSIANGGVPGSPSFDSSKFCGQRIRGVKRLTYARHASPVTQLMEMTLETFPQMVRGCIARRRRPRGPPRLRFNPRYVARRGVPLFRIVDQENRVAALIDLLSFGLYVMRILLQVHAFSFRKPDAPVDRPPERLPGRVKGLPIPEIDWLIVNRRPLAYARLARYNAKGRSAASGAPDRPVLLIHGYSASGTTFVHSSVPGNLVQKLCEKARDVWVLDMRSSAGLETATGGWAFEDMAQHDIPIAIKHVKAATGAQRVDIVCHCMGGAMFGMAVLAERDRNGRPNRLHEKIGRVVFSQVGPVMKLSPANVLAAYIMRYVRYFVPLEKYEFSPSGEVSLAGQMLDRALAAMPVPPDEFRRENPLWPPGKATPWVGTRRRMDALYSRTFSLKNMSPRVLDHIDDLFGPLSVATVSQVIHFAGFNTITDRHGANKYVTPPQVGKQLAFPMMSIHGEDNGLIDVATLALMRNILITDKNKQDVIYFNGSWDAVERCQTDSEISQIIGRACLTVGRSSLLTWRIGGHGHQDCLIGTHAGSICGRIAEYLCKPDCEPSNLDPLPLKSESNPGEPIAAPPV